ncbi:hypothetical protein CEXT_795111 [Caerostris extrusa]|uniref:Uncharacterized protein n=1 Tax=Caerostris extrusa TaxID=172846 RepID=A0AAV4TXM5_CAEEX|nr:hypothetical protein CEXT_795111 [Caerostris extrusa]
MKEHRTSPRGLSPKFNDFRGGGAARIVNKRKGCRHLASGKDAEKRLNQLQKKVLVLEKSDYEEWDYWNTTHEAELWDKNIQFNHSSWKTSSEDEILYDIYNTQPEEVLEIDEDGLELSDDWLVLDMDEEWQPDENEAEMVK